MTLGRVSQGQPGLSKALVYRWHKMRAALAAVSGSAGGSQGLASSMALVGGNFGLS